MKILMLPFAIFKTHLKTVQYILRDNVNVIGDVLHMPKEKSSTLIYSNMCFTLNVPIYIINIFFNGKRLDICIYIAIFISLYNI